MSKLLSAMLAAAFAVVTVTPVAYAADKSDEGKEMKKETKKKKGTKKKEGGEMKKEVVK